MNAVQQAGYNQLYFIKGAAAAITASIVHGFLKGRIHSLEEAKSDVQSQLILAVAAYVFLKLITNCPRGCHAINRTACSVGRFTRFVTSQMTHLVSNAVSTSWKYKATAAWSIAGFVLGGLNTINNHGSLFYRNSYDCRRADKSSLFGSINELRENDMLLNPLAACFGLFVLHNIINPTENPLPGQNRAKIIMKTLTAMLPPVLSTSLLVASTWSSRYVIHTTLENEYNIDSSGHAMIAITLLYLLVKVQEASQNILSAPQQRTLGCLVAMRAVTDFPWTFQTITDCHAVIDIAVGTLMFAASYIALKAASGTTNWVWQKAARPVLNAAWENVALPVVDTLWQRAGIPMLNAVLPQAKYVALR